MNWFQSLAAVNNKVQISTQPTFYFIGGQSNTGTNTSALTQYPTGRVDYSLMPAELKAEQTKVKVWDGANFVNYTHGTNAQYGWLNHLMYDLGVQGSSANFYKWGQGGRQLDPDGPYSVYDRATLKYNALQAWNKFKTDNPTARIIFLWCQGYTDGIDEQNSLDYGAHEVSNPLHDTGGNLGAWFQEVRDYFSLPNMKIIYNSLSDSATGSTYQANIKAGQEYVETLSPNNILVNADGLDYQTDNAHYSDQGVIGLADRYLNAINNIQ